MHHPLRLRFVPEIRNGHGSYLRTLQGAAIPEFVDINPLDIEGAVTEAMRRALPATVDRISCLLPETSKEAPHRD